MENLPIYPYRSIGSFTNGQAFHTYQIDDKIYLATTTGKTYKIFTLPDLKIKFLSPTFKNDIYYLGCYNEFVNVVFEKEIIQMKFQHKIRDIQFNKKIQFFYMLNKYFFVSFNDNTVLMYSSGTYELIHKFQLNFICKKIHHPKGYLNKIIFIGQQHFVLFNFNSGFEIFNFTKNQNFQQLLQNDNINYIADTPAVDIVIACTDQGRIISFNLKTLQIYFDFQQQNVSCADFSQNQNKKPFLISGNKQGQLILWDINKGNIFQQKQLGVSINYIQVLNFEKNEFFLLISEQNLLQIYIRDDQDKFQYRLLRQREGVLFPLSKISLYQDLFIVASTQNPKGELVRFSILNDAGSLKFSKKVKQKNKKYQTELIKKTDNIEDFRISQNKSYSLENNNMFTKHKNSQFPLFWDADNVTIRKLFLELISEYKGKQDDKYLQKMKKFRICSALEVSNCGNYLFLGYDDGLLIKITTQKGVFVSKFDYKQDEQQQINNIYSDIYGNHLIIIKNKKIEKVDFYTGKVLNSKNVDFFINNSFYDRENNLLSLVYNKNNVKFVNTLNQEIIREIQLDDDSQILDIQIASLTQKILISTNCKKLQIWDLFLAEKVSEFQLDKNILSIQIQEKKNRIFTVIEGEKEIFIWNIKNLNLTLNETINIQFESHINQYPTNPKLEFLLKPQQTNISSLNLNDIQKELEDVILKSFKDNKDTLLKKRQKICFLQEQKAKQLYRAENLEEENAIKDISEVNQQQDIPFFLDFSDNFLDQLKQKTEGTLEQTKLQSRRVIRQYNVNEILQQRLNLLEKSVMNIDQSMLKDLRNYQKKMKKEENYEKIWQCFQDLEFKEIDLYLKNICMDEQNVTKLVLLCLYLSLIRSGVNLALAILKLILQNIYDKFDKKYFENYQKVLDLIKKNMEIRNDRLADDYYNSIAILESMTQRVSF